MSESVGQLRNQAGSECRTLDSRHTPTQPFIKVNAREAVRHRILWGFCSPTHKILLKKRRLREWTAINQSSNYSHLHLNWNILTSVVAIKSPLFLKKPSPANDVVTENMSGKIAVHAEVEGACVKLQTNWYSQLMLIKLFVSMRCMKSFFSQHCDVCYGNKECQDVCCFFLSLLPLCCQLVLIHVTLFAERKKIHF